MLNPKLPHSGSCRTCEKTVLSENTLDKNNPDTAGASLQALTSAALVLPGLLLQPVQAAETNTDADSFSFHYSRFQEGKRKLFTVPNKLKPIQADVTHASGRLSLTDRVKFSFNFSRDVWSGATPITTAPLANKSYNPIIENAPNGKGVVVTGASPYLTSNDTPVRLDRNLNFYRQDPSTKQFGIDNRAVEVLASASPEVRNAADFKVGYEWNDAALDLGGGFSSENDFQSAFGSFGGRLDFNQKLTSVKFGGGYTSSDIKAILDSDSAPYLTKSAYNNQIERRGGSEILHGRRQDWTASFGVTQILNKGSLFDTNIGYTHSRGFLENPYKAMTVVFIDPEQLSSNQEFIGGNVQGLIEQRPDIRNQLAISSKYIQHIAPLDAALHFNYKFSFDDWGIHTNTFTLDWVQPLGYGWSITPRIRYYSQDAADFYDPYLISKQAYRRNAVDEQGRRIFVDVNNPEIEYVRNDNLQLEDSQGNTIDGNQARPKLIPFDHKKLPKNFSSDHRLSGYGSLSGGVTLNKKFAKGIELQAGFEYYVRSSGLKLGGSGGSSFANFDYYVASAALKVDIEKFNFTQVSSGGNHDHHTHENHQKGHHHSPVPAGVMAGHMMENAGDWMIGYRFMFGHMGGKTLNGSRAATDQEIVDFGCSTETKCRFTPTFMNMKMHMLNIMYAPTDWLNLMLMPKFVDMEMNIRELSGRPPAVPEVHEHTGIAGHATGGVGDTMFSALLHLFKMPGHKLHLGLGFSAPTGDAGLDFRRTFRIDGGLVHFGMQLGSGTWDFLPSLTYNGQYSRWFWGAQLNGVKRMEKQNKSGYRLGDIFQATTWGGFKLTKWLSASIRGIYTSQGAIHGDFNSFNGRSGPHDFPANQGGKFWDIGFGVTATMPRGRWAGNSLSFEWLQPIHDDMNGYRLERKGALSASWNYHF